MIKNLTILLLLLTPVFLVAQQNSISTSFNIKKAGTAVAGEIKDDYMPVLHNLEKPAPGSENYRSYLLLLKEQIKNSPLNSSFKTSLATQEADTPIVHKSFEGNDFNLGAPNDNDMAISNGGKLVSVKNTNIFMYDVMADSLLLEISLEAFADTLGLPQDNYDPKVVYDPAEDKFIIVFLDGRLDSNSYIIVAFSQTNNPAAGWNYYALPGGPLNDTTWSDYPIVALTGDELFITVNLLKNNQSWQLGFTQSVIWQIDKMDGYSGAPALDATLHSNIKYGGRPLRNLCLVQGGSHTTGPNMYLLSNRNFDLTNDTVFLLEITGKQASSPTVKVAALKSSTAYGLAPDGKQLGTQVLQTNDSRVLGAFIENNTIQYVQNSINHASGRAAVYHGIINNVSNNPVAEGYIIAVDSLDFGYPNIGYSGKYPGDDEAIITFLHTAVNVYPGFSSVFYDGNGNHSKRALLKSGETWVNLPGGSFERWGDYSGSQRKYNEPGKVWVAGSFGKKFTIQFNDWHSSGTWLAELASPDTTSQPPVAIAERPDQIRKIKTFPNPSHDMVMVAFNLHENVLLDVSLYDINGQKIKTLYLDKGKKGENLFSFSVKPLPAGAYFLTISSNNGEILTEKIVVGQ